MKSRQDLDLAPGSHHNGGGEGVEVAARLVARKKALHDAIRSPRIRTIVFHPSLRDSGRMQPSGGGRGGNLTFSGSGPQHSAEERLEEAVNLAAAIDLDVVAQEIARVSEIKPSTYLGPGKVEAFKQAIVAQDIELAIADCSLSPVQQRNLERAWGIKVIDRTGLILEIFGARAQTREGRLQVELANLTYQKSRLVRSWTHLERQRGGLGKVGGPGETQIEADRRLIDERITKIRQALDKVVRTRELHRASRRKIPAPIVALVGYTNAGKSTLFNRLTSAGVRAEDMLFATLDPTMRRLKLPSAREVILSDTVGFISDLPTHLVAAFRATLEEVIEADIILHVRDIAHPATASQRADVEKVLKSLNIETGPGHRIIEILNKIDLLPADDRTEIVNRSRGRDDATALSAKTGDGCAGLLALIDRLLDDGARVADVKLPNDAGRVIAWLYKHGDVLARIDGPDMVSLKVKMDLANWGKFEKQGHGGPLPRPST